MRKFPQRSAASSSPRDEGEEDDDGLGIWTHVRPSVFPPASEKTTLSKADSSPQGRRLAPLSL